MVGSNLLDILSLCGHHTMLFLQHSSFVCAVTVTHILNIFHFIHTVGVSLKHGIRNSGITEYHVKMADDSYANKCRWHELLPRKARRSNEAKGNGYIDNSLEVKTAANRSFLADKLEKVTIQASIGSASMNSPWEGGGGHRRLPK